ncbi:co-chaperone YbbN [Haematomicrobium sanguinis]|uniref:co-chaperone YbbN n=1 Tax=Haematomicrobium sanguinis TaxID=479106 RepID=UPI000AD82934|nr:tetratricopeptide repeat protein [Haematomicrobium sanguinis]
MSSSMNGAPGPSMNAANLRGAVDLSTLGARKGAIPGAGGAGAGGAGAGGDNGNPWAVTMTEQSFPQVIGASSKVPVLVAVVDPAQNESSHVLGLLDQVVSAAQGKLLLAAVDAAANPNIVQAFAVQALPTVVAVIKNQPVPLFSGPISEDELAGLLQQLMTLAAQQGVTGRLPGEASDAEDGGADAPLPPLHQEAFDAIEKGDYRAAEEAYRKALAESPADQDAQVGLHQVGLLKRTADMDAAEVREAGAGQPDNLQAQLAVADLDMVGGHVDDAFNRLLVFIGAHVGEDREAARSRLVDFFALVGAGDERVVKARGKLASLLF